MLSWNLHSWYPKLQNQLLLEELEELRRKVWRTSLHQHPRYQVGSDVDLLLLWSNATLVFVYVNLVVNEPNDSLFQERELQAANEDLRKQVYIQNIASH